MKLFSFFKSRDKPKNSLPNSFPYLFGRATSGQMVNERTAMNVSTVYACVRVLSETLAYLPLSVYKRENGNSLKHYDHSLYYLLHDAPNPEMTSFVFRETLMTHLLLWGNAYAQIIRDGRGQVMALYPLMPSKMDVNRVNGKLVYTYYLDADESPYSKKGRYVDLRKDEVLHIPGLGFDGLIGYSPIAMAKNAVGMCLATEGYGSTFFENGANPGGVLEHPGILKDPERVRQSWNAVYQGSKNANKVAVLEEGMSFKAIGLPPEQAQFLETRKFQVNEICRIFRVPPHMVGDLERATFSNIEHQSLEFVKNTLSPWTVRWEQGLQEALLLPSEKKNMFVRFNLDGLLRGSYKERMEGYRIGIQNGFFSPNDIREMEALNKIPNGDVYMVNGNMIELQDVGLPYKEVKGNV